MFKIQSEENLEGIKVKPTPVPFSVRIDRSGTGDFDAVLGGWLLTTLTQAALRIYFVTGNSYNRGQWSNKEYDDVVKASSTRDASGMKSTLG